MNIVYLTWGETPRSYGVFNSQVISQFVANCNSGIVGKFSFISAIPLIHSGMVREKFNYKNEIEKIRHNLGDIEFIRISIYAPQNFVNSSKATFRFMHLGSHQRLATILKKQQADIVHCRGYHATYAALLTRERYQLNYKVIFDARGLWPEEMALKKNYEDNNPNYLFLKNIEQLLFEKSDIIITVSDTMKQHYASMTRKNIENIYLSAPVEQWNIPAKEKKEATTLVYVGALADDTWHKPQSLASLYNHFRTQWSKAHLVIITTSNHEAIKAHFQHIPEDEITLTSTKNHQDLYNILSTCHFSCLPYFTPSTIREKRISDTVLAVKTVEYLSAGLPVLCNKYCGGAAAIIENNNLGINYDPESFTEIQKSRMDKLLDKKTSLQAVELAKQLFSYKENAIKYKKIYESLAK